MRKHFCFVAVRKGLHQVSCENAFELFIQFSCMPNFVYYMMESREKKSHLLFDLHLLGVVLKIFTQLLLEFSFLATKRTFPPLLPLTYSF